MFEGACGSTNTTWNTRMIGRETAIADVHYTISSENEQERDAKCEGTRFYIYETKLTMSPRDHVTNGQYWQGLNYSPLNCRFGMYGTEVLFHEFFRACRTEDPWKADFFFVPSYFKCLSALNYMDEFDSNLERPSEELFNQTLKHVESLPYFARRDGVDHIWLFSWGRYPCLLPYRGRLRHARFLQVEDRCEDINNGEPPTSTFSRWKDIIIPGNTDLWRTELLQSTNRPLQERRLLGCFFGRHGHENKNYVNVSVRMNIINEFGNGSKGLAVGHFAPNFHDLLSNAIYCLAPRGITPWTGHLYQALLSGCIPVILSDYFEVPFPWLDWSNFCIRWAEEHIEDLPDFLRSVPQWQRKVMKQRVDEVACWFDYSSPDPCSPYHGVLRQLRARLPDLPEWRLPGQPVAFQTVIPGMSQVRTLEEAKHQSIHGRLLYVRAEKRRLLEMYLEKVDAPTDTLRTL